MNLTQNQLAAQLSFGPLLQYENVTQGSQGRLGNDSNKTFDSLLHPPDSLLSSPSSVRTPDSLLLPPPDGSDLESMLLWTVHEPTTIALTFMYSLSFLVGFAGNVMSIRVLVNRRSERLAGVSATRNLLVNLAVCDLAVVCVCMPITLGHQIYTAWVYGDFLCRAVPFTQAVSVSASVLTLTVISVNRYYSVRCPLRARSLFTRQRILATIVVVWVVSSAICAPLVFMNRRDEISLGSFVIPVCQEVWPRPRLKQAYNVLLFVALYCIPVTFNLSIGFLTGRRLWGGQKTAFSELDPRSRALHASRLKMRKKIAKMVVALVLLFAVSWLPLYLADIWIDREHRPPSWLLQTRPFAQWLGLTNSSLNPICYCFIGDLYRSAKVFRTRYHQRIVALFSSSFSNDATITTTVNEHDVAVVTLAASTTTLPKLFSFARGQGAGQGGKLVVRRGSDHSISDWYKSSPSVCGSSLLPSQLHTPHTLPVRSVSGDQIDTFPLKRDSVEERVHSFPFTQLSVDREETFPLRRHSGNEGVDTFPLRTKSVEGGTLPLRRHSDDRIGTLPLWTDSGDRTDSLPSQRYRAEQTSL